MNLEKDQSPTKLVRKKIINDEYFRRFLSLLSERDCFIARILYCTDLKIQEVISMNHGDIINSNLPVHLKKELQLFCKNNGKEDLDTLIFKNCHGDKVDRTHINQAFSRAGNSLRPPFKITPGDLTKWVMVTAEDIQESQTRS